MPKPYEWPNSDALIKDLRKDKKILAKQFQDTESDLGEIVRHSVEGNTFRAFHHMPDKPSVVFREWALKKLSSYKTIALMKNVSSTQDYEKWLEGFSSSFYRHWKRQMRECIPYGPSRKLPDLLMKRVMLWNIFTEYQRNRLINYLHIPLDSYSLLAIRSCIQEFPHAEEIGKIPKTATMNSIYYEAQYNQVQFVMRSIAKRADVPPIYIDVIAWDRSHK